MADSACNSSSNSSGPHTAAAPSEHSNATPAAEAAPAVASAGTRPLAELLTFGPAHMHELLGRYRWCSQQYLQGQVRAVVVDLLCIVVNAVCDVCFGTC
jgi:hypothetical protein